MITLGLTFWIFLIIFGVIGAMRGWAKELLVSFSVLVALFIQEIMKRIPPLAKVFEQTDSTGFWVPAILLMVLVFAGYQTPMIMRFASGKLVREKLADVLLGFFIGMLNGYLIFGTLWFFLEKTKYPFEGITAPDPVPFIVNYLPPAILNNNMLFAAVGVAFLFVLLVFI